MRLGLMLGVLLFVLSCNKAHYPDYAIQNIEAPDTAQVKYHE